MNNTQAKTVVILSHILFLTLIIALMTSNLLENVQVYLLSKALTIFWQLFENWNCF